uniref:Uncharacterized protein n=1 Tax=Tritonibacter mobilis F1926 TaxID=1265309 RepID=A0A1B1A6I5_9RHOB|nr:hypothetical protein K529_015430 [Tritonibacter mobilis F1926]
MKNRKIKRLCTRVPGCRAFKCGEDGCLRKSVKVHQIARTGNEHHRFYATKVWKAIRDVCLGRMPICASCYAAGVITPASHVDHIRSFRKNWSLFIDMNNVQPLCHGPGTNSCHSRKTAAENAAGVDYIEEWDFSDVVKKYMEEN